MEINNDKQIEEKDNKKTEIKRKQPKKISLDYIIPVRSGVQGGLTYISRKNGYEITWDEYGAIEYLPYEELVAMRNGHKRFFIDNWVFIEDTDKYTAEDIYKALQVDRYYKNIFDIDIDSVLSLECDSLKNKLSDLTNGMKDTIATRAKQLIIDKSPIMDSTAKRELIESILDVELIPKEY